MVRMGRAVRIVSVLAVGAALVRCGTLEGAVRNGVTAGDVCGQRAAAAGAATTHVDNLIVDLVGP
jgi:hypothetical protein